MACNRDLDGEGLSQHDRPDAQRPPGGDLSRLNLGRWDPAALQSAREVSRSIPHFSIRLAACLDELAITFGDPLLREHRATILGFNFCKQLVQTLFKVVGKKRRAIVTERPTFIRTDATSSNQ